MQEQLPNNINGADPYPEKRTIEEALAYDYDFSIGDVIARAWEKVNGVKLPLFVALLIIMVINTIINVFLEIIPEQAAIVFNIALSIAACGLSTNFTIIALKHLRGEKLIDALKCFYSLSNIYITLVIATVVATILVVFGFLLFIIPGIYLSIGYCLMQWIIIDHPEVSPWQALEISRKIVTKHWFKFFGLYFILTIILIISVIPLGIGLIWTLPLTILAPGVVYQIIFEKSNALVI
ncbi:DUF975 family protein [Entomomonas moraniae]|uniref:DUF975 family protein n=1 Tax=Entomomonas moraniae TaxID=2213226 RepID=A0A3Q9JL24_9GAMM|nr:DUF975 family protein [Entomomonas moraniae]AZS52011.1 DUF975 family protein [Entomomonas moraniae]